MDLINASAEECRGKYNGTHYVFPPNELVHLSDDAGHHLSRKLAPRGVLQVSYGDNPAEIKLTAMRAIVAHHERAVKAHEDQVKTAIDQKNPIPAEPDAYGQAKLALKVYGPALEKAEKKEKERADALATEKMQAAVEGEPEQIDLDDLDQDQLRAMVQSLGGEVDMRHGPKKLKAQIKKLKGG